MADDVSHRRACAIIEQFDSLDPRAGLTVHRFLHATADHADPSDHERALAAWMALERAVAADDGVADARERCLAAFKPLAG